MIAHFGVYGLIEARGRILLVRKTRGPYQGLLDLPGGAPDPTDLDRMATLKREVAEETGLALADVGSWHDFKFLVAKDSIGRSIEFEHSGVWAAATASDYSLQRMDLETISLDTGGSIWMGTDSWRQRNDLSHLAKTVLTAAEMHGLVASGSGSL